MAGVLASSTATVLSLTFNAQLQNLANLIELKQPSPKHSHDAVRLVGVKT